MKLPAGERAVLEISKLRDYCLSTQHPRGRHKARVFHSALGLTRDHAAELAAALLQAAAESDSVVEGESDRFGRRYSFDLEYRGPTGTARIRSVWIVRAEEGIPRFVTCYAL